MGFALLPGADLTVESVIGHAGLVIRQTGRAVAVIAVSCDEDRAAVQVNAPLSAGDYERKVTRCGSR